MTTTPETAKPRFAPQMPNELLASSTFLLKRLGFAAKDQALASYEETGLHPYHYAIMLVLDEGSADTQGSMVFNAANIHMMARDLAFQSVGSRPGNWFAM